MTVPLDDKYRIKAEIGAQFFAWTGSRRTWEMLYSWSRDAGLAWAQQDEKNDGASILLCQDMTMNKAWFYRLCCHDPRHKHRPRQFGDGVPAGVSAFEFALACGCSRRVPACERRLSRCLATIPPNSLVWSHSKE